jgi:hypothetical protein
MYNVTQAMFGKRQDLVALSWDYGDPVYRNHFVNFTMDARLPGGARFGGGVDTGWSVRDTCYVVDSPQELLYCRVTTPFSANTQIKFNGSYPMKYGIVLAGTFQNLAGPSCASYPATSAEVAKSLGRPLSGSTRTVTGARRPRHALRGSVYPPRSPGQQDLHGDLSPAAQPGRLQRAEQRRDPSVNSTYDARWRRSRAR